MRIAVAQYPASQDFAAERDSARSAVLGAADGGAALVVLPEPAAPEQGSVGDWDAPRFIEVVSEAAQTAGVTVVAGLWEPLDPAEGSAGRTGEHDGVRVHNTVVVLDPRGQLLTRYRKLHLYDAFAVRESDRYLAGDIEPPVVELPGDSGLRLGMMTCYDLRFPEVARDLAVRGADVVAVPSAWASGPLKEEHWTLLLRARALENTMYVAGAGRCPPDHVGRSAVVDPLAVTLCALGEAPGVTSAEVGVDRLTEVRQRLPVLSQRRYRDPRLR